MVIKNAEFITTVANDKILTYTKNEFAFVGRSNAGKSSLINALTNNKNLAKTGQKAGVTKNINYFKIVVKQHLLICQAMDIIKQANKNKRSGLIFWKTISKRRKT